MSKKIQHLSNVIENLKTVWPDFEITVEELSSPTVSTVQKFYERLLQVLHVDLLLATKYMLDRQINADAYSEIAHIFTMYLSVKGIFQYLQPLQSFGLHDFLQPVTVRHRSNVRAVVNFLFYTDSLAAEWLNPIQNNVEEDLAVVEQLDKEINEWKKKLHCLSLVNDKHLADLNANEHNLLVVNATKEQHAKNEELEARARALDKEYNAVKNQKKEAMIQLENKLQIRNELKSQIVDNSQAILLEEQTLKAQIAQASADEAEIATRLEHKNHFVTNCKTLLEKCLHVTDVKDMADFLNTFERNMSVRQSIEDVDQQQKNHLKSCNLKLQDVGSVQLDELEKHLQSSQLIHAARKTEFVKEIQSLETEAAALAVKATKQVDKERRLDKKIGATKDKIAESAQNMVEIEEYCLKQGQSIMDEYGLFEANAKTSLDEIVALLDRKHNK